jgi:hypothetical protein
MEFATRLRRGDVQPTWAGFVLIPKSDRTSLTLLALILTCDKHLSIAYRRRDPPGYEEILEGRRSNTIHLSTLV